MNAIENLLKDTPLPPVVRVRQRFDDTQLDDPVETLREKILANEGYQSVQPGSRVAVAVGSRGILHIRDFTLALVGLLKEKGARPFIFPAMGSHGGATAKGQAAILAELGITEKSMGVPILSSMETVRVGTTETGLPVVMDRFAAEADGIVFLNRIKPHTSFRGPYESGLMKMITIGIGKQAGAGLCHELGFGRMAENIPAIAEVALREKNFLFACGVVENAYHETCIIEVLNKDEIAGREPALLTRARELAPRLYFDQLDVCVMDEIGKNISGTGFDTAVVGRYHTPYASGGPRISKLGILDLTEESHGNANGIGMADFTTRRLYEKFRPEQSYPNVLTSTVPASVKIPMVLENDRLLFRAAVRTCNILDKSKVRLVRFRNTLELGTLEASVSLLPEIERSENLEVCSEPYELAFDREGNLF